MKTATYLSIIFLTCGLGPWTVAWGADTVAPTKEQGVQVLQDFLAAAAAKDSAKAAELVYLPAFDANTPAGLEKILPRVVDPKVLSVAGIDGLAKGSWGPLTDTFQEGHLARAHASSKLRLKLESCYGLRHGTAFATFYLDGKQLRLLKFKNTGDE